MPQITIRSFARFRELFGEVNSVSVPEGTSVFGALLAFAKNFRRRDATPYDKSARGFRNTECSDR